MARRKVQRRTVAGYVQASRYQMERAMSAAVRCGEITDTEWRRLRSAWIVLDDLTDTVSRKRKPSK